MDVVALRTAIRSAIRACIGATATDPTTEATVEWEDDGAATAYRPVPYMDLMEMSEDTVGVDETRAEYNETDDRIDARQMGQRQIVVQVKAVSDSSCTNQSASQLIKDVRLRLRRPSILAILQAANIAVSRFGPTHRISFDQDNRMMDARVMEITFLTSDVDEQDPEAGDYFDHIEDPESTITLP